VLSDLGDREGAKNAYRESLEIRWPLAQKWPAAYMQRFLGVLSRYVQVAPEKADDPWWTLWRQLQRSTEGKTDGESPES